ncbi:hypothetical protein [Planctomicrobium sp. SH527]|uniref:hypothetical protein n=1 Tax=Planctomicrobium sp. SH527 TaxID=3448123 RepID=UPI003F5AE78A
MFYRRHTDGTRQTVPLENQFAGPTATPCWIIAGGPSLTSQVTEEIQKSPAPKFAINLAGTGLIRPNFWTSYDPTERFHRSIYLDPSVTKFVHECRAMDLVPETTYKVCECPSLYVIDRERQRGFEHPLGTLDAPVTDWQDSFIQALDIAYRLGFRQLYLAGVDMVIRPSSRLRSAARRAGVHYQRFELLGDFVRRCLQAGMTKPEVEDLSTEKQYHFDERKSLDAAIQTDFHYFRVSQYLRLARRAFALYGLNLVSVTPGSRLNSDFPYIPVMTATRRILKLAGDPETEQTQGRYTNSNDRRPAGLGPMRDFQPHFWTAKEQPAKLKRIRSRPSSPGKALASAIEATPEFLVDLVEEG